MVEGVLKPLYKQKKAFITWRLQVINLTGVGL